MKGLSALLFSIYQMPSKEKKKGDGDRKQTGNNREGFILLEELVILLVKADGVLAPKLLRFVHGTPLQAAGLEFRTVLIK